MSAVIQCGRTDAHGRHAWEVTDLDIAEPRTRYYSCPGVKSAIEDPVNHPSHYTSDPSGVECIQITRHRNFNVGNAIKYLWRAGLKDEATQIEDLEKARWYIADEIERLRGAP